MEEESTDDEETQKWHSRLGEAWHYCKIEKIVDRDKSVIGESEIEGQRKSWGFEGDERFELERESELMALCYL